jgi:hypothetical protein
MAKSNSEVHVVHRNNCNWQPNWTVDKTWPLQTCDDLNRIYQHAAIYFVAKVTPPHDPPPWARLSAQPQRASCWM